MKNRREVLGVMGVLPLSATATTAGLCASRDKPRDIARLVGEYFGADLNPIAIVACREDDSVTILSAPLTDAITLPRRRPNLIVGNGLVLHDYETFRAPGGRLAILVVSDSLNRELEAVEQKLRYLGRLFELGFRQQRSRAGSGFAELVELAELKRGWLCTPSAGDFRIMADEKIRKVAFDLI